MPKIWLAAEVEPPKPPRVIKYRLKDPIVIAQYPGCKPGEIVELTEREGESFRARGAVELAPGETDPRWEQPQMQVDERFVAKLRDAKDPQRWRQ
jgi:hypothetical protein